MIAPLVLASSSIGISLIFNSKNSSYVGLFISFLPILLFLAFRFDYGNDYLSYLYMFKEIASSGAVAYDSSQWHAEIGWFYLNRLFSSAGFFPMVIALAAFNCYVYFRFIKIFVPHRYYWLAIFLYLITPANMLVQASAMRQAIAISFFLICIEFIVKRNLLAYLAIVVLGSLFHSSILVLLPIYFFCVSRLSFNPIMIVLFLILYILLFLISGFVAESISSVILLFMSEYSVYNEKGVVNSGFGFVFYGVYLSFLLYFHDKQTDAGKVIYRLAIIGVLLMPLYVSIMIASRIGFYFGVASIAAIPLIASQISNYPTKIGFIFFNMIYILYQYRIFMSEPLWSKFFEYSSIFSYSASHWY